MLKANRGSGSRVIWAQQLARNMSIFDFVTLSFTLLVVVSVRFSDIWLGNLTSYEISNILFSILLLIS